MEIGYKLSYPFNSQTVFNAFQMALPSVKGLKVDKIDAAAGTILLKSGMSLTSWGEEVIITFINYDERQTTFSIYATPKRGNDALMRAKCQKRVDEIIVALQDTIAKHFNNRIVFPVTNLLLAEEPWNSSQQVNPSSLKKMSSIKPQSAEEIFKEKLQKKLQALGLSNLEIFLGRREIKYIPEVLLADEEVEALIQGTLDNNNGILFITNMRLIFLDRGLVYGTKLHTYLLHQVGAIEYRSGMMLAEVKIHSSGKPETTIDNVFKDQGKKFVAYANSKLIAISEQKYKPVQNQATNQISISDELIKLANLKSSGILTEEEFTSAKLKLLGNN